MIEYIFIFATAVLFTLLGYSWGRNAIKVSVEHVIDSLINDGYIKTSGTGPDMEILKWKEWEDAKASKTNS